MMLVDANLLLYAYDRESPQHGPAREWLEVELDPPEALDPRRRRAIRNSRRHHEDALALRSQEEAERPGRGGAGAWTVHLSRGGAIWLLPYGS
jgi:predicted nucleic acid-binding protein